jgi:energy-coupling factor transport system ATP-binding protein
MNEIIRAEGVGYEYITHDEDGVEEVNEALRGIDFSIEEGEFVAVLGMNGSGKSTLAKLLNAIYLPSQGDVVVLGMNTKDESNVLNIRKAVGMVFQNPDNQIIANIVEEDVAFGPENLGVPTDEIVERVNDSLQRVAMTDYRNVSPNNLSGGQKQRIAIAGVLAMKPRCIILDESTAMLDPNGRKEVIETVTKLNHEEGITVILITHYMEEVVYADRVIIMEKGDVVMTGTPKEVFSHGEEIRRLGLDVPQVTELADMLRADGWGLPEGIIEVDELVEALTAGGSGRQGTEQAGQGSGIGAAQEDKTSAVGGQS